MRETTCGSPGLLQAAEVVLLCRSGHPLEILLSCARPGLLVRGSGFQTRESAPVYQLRALAPVAAHSGAGLRMICSPAKVRRLHSLMGWEIMTMRGERASGQIARPLLLLALQSAIDDCARKGGGVVRLTRGTYLGGNGAEKGRTLSNATVAPTTLPSTRPPVRPSSCWNVRR
jgi:hypothetical protein